MDFGDIPEESISSEEVQVLVNETVNTVIGSGQFQHSLVDKWTSYVVEGCLKKLASLGKPLKYIVSCNIQQRVGAGLHIASAASWSKKTDGKVSVVFENPTTTCTVIVYWRLRGAMKNGKLTRQRDVVAAGREGGGGAGKSEEGCRVSVIQWNVLADGLAQSGDFVKADARILEWDYRAPLILEEIVEAGIDIACLEEVNHFDDTLKPELAKLGYIGCFVPKTSSTCVELGFPEDGLAIFYKEDKYEVVTPFGPGNYVDEKGNAMSQVYATIGLRDRATGLSFVVALTHLKAKGPFEAVRVQQVQQLLAVLQEERRRGDSATDSESPMPVILCGDFNAEPTGDCIGAVLASGLGLESAYPSDSDVDEAFTTWKFRPGGEKVQIIDHIFFSAEAFRPISRLQLLDRKSIGECGLPSASYPSDHVAIGIELLLR